MENILVVDDEKNLLEVIKDLLEFEGYQVRAATDPYQAYEIAKSGTIDLVVSDIRMEGMDGIELLKIIKKHDKDLPVILITAYIDIQMAVKAMELGAYEYVTKPFNSTELLLLVKQALTNRKLRLENISLKNKFSPDLEKLIGTSDKIMDVFKSIEKVSRNSSTVLITGESGTGKELVAKAIHYSSPRAKYPFAGINCAAIPPNLLVSELFGHEKGAFTGADKKTAGVFLSADKGTVFLDEIGAVPNDIQVSLLRVIQEREVKVLGDSEPRKIDVRIISATNENLKALVKQGLFREDLYYRLSVVPIAMPPLRSRCEDIPILIHHFLIKYCFNVKDHFYFKTFSQNAMDALTAYEWPGNVRELENTIERLVTLVDRNYITIDDLPEEIHAGRPAVSAPNYESSLKEHLEEQEKKYIRYFLETYAGDKKTVAQKLDIDLATLYRKIDKYGLAAAGRKKEESDGL